MYTGHALDINRFITIGDITYGFAWWVSYMGQKSLWLKNLSFCSKDINAIFNSHFSILTMLKINDNFRNCEVAFFP